MPRPSLSPSGHSCRGDTPVPRAPRPSGDTPRSPPSLVRTSLETGDVVFPRQYWPDHSKCRNQPLGPPTGGVQWGGGGRASVKPPTIAGTVPPLPGPTSAETGDGGRSHGISPTNGIAERQNRLGSGNRQNPGRISPTNGVYGAQNRVCRPVAV